MFLQITNKREADFLEFEGIDPDLVERLRKGKGRCEVTAEEIQTAVKKLLAYKKIDIDVLGPRQRRIDNLLACLRAAR